MSKLVFLALLGMVVVAAAVDAEVQKKHYKKADYDEEEKHVSDYVTPHFKHVEFSLDESAIIKTFPCDPESQILGSTVAQEATLAYKEKAVGNVFWSGIVVKSLKDYAAHTKVTKVNYEVVFEITDKKYAGEIVAGAVGAGIESQETEVLAILGGSGAFKGASGTITWTGGDKPTYVFDLYLPKHGEDGDYKYYAEEEDKY